MSKAFMESFVETLVPRIRPCAAVSFFADPARPGEFTLRASGREDALTLTTDDLADPVAELTRIEEAIEAWLGDGG